jgi:hypothetical protein
MAENEFLGDRGRALEDEYFHRRDRELVEKIRKAAAAEKTRQDMGTKTGVHDAEVIQALLDLGFTTDTVVLLPLVPIVQMAWAEGGVSAAERDLIVKLARSRGVDPGSAADRVLTEWLTTRPGDGVFTQAGRLINAVLASESGQPGGLTADDLVKHAEAIAAASGGILGIGRVSAEERALLTSIATSLKGRQV